MTGSSWMHNDQMFLMVVFGLTVHRKAATRAWSHLSHSSLVGRFIIGHVWRSSRGSFTADAGWRVGKRASLRAAHTPHHQCGNHWKLRKKEDSAWGCNKAQKREAGTLSEVNEALEKQECHNSGQVPAVKLRDTIYSPAECVDQVWWRSHLRQHVTQQQCFNSWFKAPGSIINQLTHSYNVTNYQITGQLLRSRNFC